MVEGPDAEAVQDDIASEAQARRAAGAYPPGLEEELDRQARALAVQLRGDVMARLVDRLAELRERSVLQVSLPPATSKVPGGALAHRALARVMNRHANAALREMQAFMDALRAAEEAQLAALLDTRARLDALLDRFAEHVGDTTG